MKHYKSNLSAPDLVPAFKYYVPIKPGNAHGHISFCDPEIFEGCGTATVDEAAILFNVAKAVGGHWLEIGSHTGWTTAHIAHGADFVCGLDPEFSEPAYNKTKSFSFFHIRANENIERAGVKGKVAFYGNKSEDFLLSCAGRSMGNFDYPDNFDGAFIDGNHEPHYPWMDAILCLPHLKDRCAVVFHDSLGWPVQEGIKALVDNGFKFRMYKTPQILAVCWRGDVAVPDHVPDPEFDWDRWMIKTCGIFKGSDGVTYGPKGAIGVQS